MDNEKAYKLPMRAFELFGAAGEAIKLRIENVEGFPNETSINGGYEITCRLTISIGNYNVQNTAYPASTGALYHFYTALKECNDELYGKATYEVTYVDGAELTLGIEYDGGNVTVTGAYRDIQDSNTVLNFEFATDQSYIKSVLTDLKKIVSTFGTNKGI